jgi:hypothetical protein
MPNYRMNKTIAGYHLLMILSAVDYNFHIEEEKVIREYLFQEFPFQVNLDNEIHTIANLHHHEWKAHFLKCLDDFTDEATDEEKNHFLHFAIHLSKADEVITKEENEYLQLLFDAWDYSRE